MALSLSTWLHEIQVNLIKLIFSLSTISKLSKKVSVVLCPSSECLVCAHYFKMAFTWRVNKSTPINEVGWSKSIANSLLVIVHKGKRSTINCRLNFNKQGTQFLKCQCSSGYNFLQTSFNTSYVPYAPRSHPTKEL